MATAFEPGTYRPRRADRIKGVVGAILLQSLIGLALVLGLSVSVPRPAGEVLLHYITLSPDRDPPPPAPATAPVRTRPAAPQPPAKRATPVPVIVPPPVVPVLELPPPITAAPIVDMGISAAAGASDAAALVGGGGDSGYGLGGGTPARWLRGRIKDSDYPHEALAGDQQGVIETRYTIGVNGRVTQCTVTRSSGSPVLDATTCRIMIERYRFAPARDDAGRKVAEEVYQEHRWVIDHSEGAPPEPR